MTRYMLKNDPETMEQIRGLVREGLRVPQIAQKINLNMTTIRKFIKENNLEYITRRGAYLKHDWDSIITDYKAGVQTKDIVEKHGTTGGQISRNMKKKGIERPENFEPDKPKLIQNRYDWKAITLDFQAGMQVDDICEKHEVGEQYLSWGMKDRGVTRPEWYKRNQVNLPRKNQIIIDKIKFLAAENLTIAGIARVIKFTLSKDQIPDYPLNYAAIEAICTQHQITTKG